MLFIHTLLLITLFYFTSQCYAAELEISSYLGYTFSPNLASSDNNDTISVEDTVNFSLGFAWQAKNAKRAKNKGQGQILINYISRDFTATETMKDINSKKKQSFDTLYFHFNGVSFIQESGYNTTISLGFGASYFDSDFDNAIYPSLSTAIGTRYELSPQLSFISEVRAYATLVKDDKPLFCQKDSCIAYFDNDLWFDANISIGLAYQF